MPVLSTLPKAPVMSNRPSKRSSKSDNGRSVEPPAAGAAFVASAYSSFAVEGRVPPAASRHRSQFSPARRRETADTRSRGVCSYHREKKTRCSAQCPHYLQNRESTQSPGSSDNIESSPPSQPIRLLAPKPNSTRDAGNLSSVPHERESHLPNRLPSPIKRLIVDQQRHEIRSLGGYTSSVRVSKTAGLPAIIHAVDAAKLPQSIPGKKEVSKEQELVLSRLPQSRLYAAKTSAAGPQSLKADASRIERSKSPPKKRFKHRSQHETIVVEKSSDAVVRQGFVDLESSGNPIAVINHTKGTSSKHIGTLDRPKPGEPSWREVDSRKADLSSHLFDRQSVTFSSNLSSRSLAPEHPVIHNQGEHFANPDVKWHTRDYTAQASEAGLQVPTGPELAPGLSLMDSTHPDAATWCVDPKVLQNRVASQHVNQGLPFKQPPLILGDSRKLEGDQHGIDQTQLGPHDQSDQQGQSPSNVFMGHSTWSSDDAITLADDFHFPEGDALVPSLASDKVAGLANTSSRMNAFRTDYEL
ncbi:MAG: hypothetical protein M1818_006999 [Claussenomyces sp. TS43310]|nr:MAG: hypothetical protein M1818_006999 [Claussenomyces sp. TS43310]